MPTKRVSVKGRPYRSFDDPPTFNCEKCGKLNPYSWASNYKGSGCWKYGQRFCSTACANRSRPPKTWLDKHGYPQMTDVDGVQRATHRVVMEKILGRKLLPTETVHHKDGNRKNFDESNLELWSTRHGKGQRVVDHVAFAKETLKIYGEGPFDASFIEQGRADVAAMLAATGN